MHDSFKRLLDYARRTTVGQAEPVQSIADLGRRLGKSSAVLSAWKTRGVSKQGALEAEEEFGCTVRYILEGVEDNEKRMTADYLNSWLMDASPRSLAVIEKLAMLARKNLLRDDDWDHIEKTAALLKQRR